MAAAKEPDSKEASPVISPLTRELSSDQLMEIADDVQVFSNFYQHMVEYSRLSPAERGDPQQRAVEVMHSTASNASYSHACTAVVPSMSSALLNEPGEEIGLKMYLMGTGKDQRHICRQALQLEEAQKEKRLQETEQQLKSLRSELQKTQDIQEAQRIQRETAKVYTGTVIQQDLQEAEEVGGGLGFSRSNSWCRTEMIEDDTLEIERPETAEQFCQKLQQRQRPPVLVQPSMGRRLLSMLKKIICCTAMLY